MNLSNDRIVNHGHRDVSHMQLWHKFVILEDHVGQGPAMIDLKQLNNETC